MVDPLSYFSYQPVPCVIKAVVYYPVCGMVHIKESLLLIEKSSPYSDGSRFLLSLFKWSFTICSMPYNCK